MQLFAESNGRLLGIWPESRAGKPDYVDPQGVSHVTSAQFGIDESTNPDLIADLMANQDRYSLVLVGGVPQLQKNGTPVTIAAAGQMFSILSALYAGFPDSTLKSAVVALWNGTATSNQQQKAVAYMLFKLRQAGII